MDINVIFIPSNCKSIQNVNTKQNKKSTQYSLWLNPEYSLTMDGFLITKKIGLCYIDNKYARHYEFRQHCTWYRTGITSIGYKHNSPKLHNTVRFFSSHGSPFHGDLYSNFFNVWYLERIELASAYTTEFRVLSVRVLNSIVIEHFWNPSTFPSATFKICSYSQPSSWQYRGTYEVKDVVIDCKNEYKLWNDERNGIASFNCFITYHDYPSSSNQIPYYLIKHQLFRLQLE